MNAKDTLEKNGIMPSDLICSSQFDCILRSMEEYATSREQEAWGAAMSEFSQRLTAHTLGEPREFKTLEDWRKVK